MGEIRSLVPEVGDYSTDEGDGSEYPLSATHFNACIVHEFNGAAGAWKEVECKLVQHLESGKQGHFKFGRELDQIFKARATETGDDDEEPPKKKGRQARLQHCLAIVHCPLTW